MRRKQSTVTREEASVGADVVTGPANVRTLAIYVYGEWIQRLDEYVNAEVHLESLEEERACDIFLHGHARLHVRVVLRDAT